MNRIVYDFWKITINNFSIQNKLVHVHTLCYETYTLVQFYVKIKMSCYSSVLVEYTILLQSFVQLDPLSL